MKQTIKLTESDLRRMISESVKKALKEADSKINIDSKTRDIYAIACEIIEAYDFKTALNVLEKVKKDLEYYGDENGPYKTRQRNLLNGWEYNHYDQLDTNDGEYWGMGW